MSGYAQTRLKSIGFNPDQDYAFFKANPDEPFGQAQKKPIFWADDKDNLCIGVFGLDREFITVDLKASRSKLDNKIFHFIRWSEPKIIDGEEKKITPVVSGQGVYPYIPLSVVEKFKTKTKINTLVITEGQIKAYVGSKYGLDIVGIPGIQIWNAGGQSGIFQAIANIITTCQVEVLIYLSDADTLAVEWKEGKDLGKRPQNFCNAVIQFKERTRDFGCKQYYAHINEKSLSKGIDDLLIDNKNEAAQIINDLIANTGSTTHFNKMDLGSKTITKIKEYFGIDDDVKSFYNKYEHIIGLRPFVYLRGLYIWDEITNKVKYEKCGESAQFIMVDSTYFINGGIPTKYGEVENVLKPIKPAGIKGMFKNKSRAFINEESFKIFIGKLLYDIPYYNGFINRPGHLDYKKEFVVHDKDGHEMKYYNKYLPLSHNPEEGDIPLSLDFIKHIFGTGTITHNGKVYNEWDLGLDYLQLLYMDPCQMLPILFLVSNERGTGKTKFWEWVGAIFQGNVKPINSHQLNGQFTSLFASSLLVYIDEAFLDKKETMEKLKSLVASEKGKLEYKGVDSDIIDNFLKVGGSSNDEESFVQITDEEVRYWIRKIKPIPQEKQYKTWFTQLRKEIPALLYYLERRTMATEYEHRQWFAPELIKTEALDAIVRESRSSMEITIEEVVRDYMSMHNKAVVQLSTPDLKELIQENTTKLSTLRWALEQKMGLKNTGVNREYEKYKMEYDNLEQVEKTVTVFKKSTPYTITASSVFSLEQIFDTFTNVQIFEMEKKELHLYGKSLFWKKFNIRNKEILRKVDVFKPRSNNALEMLIKECGTFQEAYQTTYEINENI